MHHMRRWSVMTLVAAAGYLLCPASLVVAQRPIFPPPPPAPAETQAPATRPNPHTIEPRQRALLIKNEREFRAGIEQLYQLTSELRNEVEKTTTRDVLSVRMYKKTEAIEKLAKQLKNKAKGID